MAEPALHIGTSGWNYSHWRGSFYPGDMDRNEWLEYYITRFDTVEINNSFYRLPDASTFRKWAETVPDDFLFSVKASRYITHMKKLKDPWDSVGRFYDRVKNLNKKAGPILFQLPPRWNRNPGRLQSFLGALPGPHRVTFEFRDASWWCDEVYGLLRAHNAAFCIYELAGTLSPKEVTADFVYIRLHGPEGAYEGLYDQRALSGWAGAISTWNRRGREVFCYFDNDQNGYAAQNARELRGMLEGG